MGKKKKKTSKAVRTPKKPLDEVGGKPEVTANLSVKKIAGGYADCEVKLVAAGGKECKQVVQPVRHKF